MAYVNFVYPSSVASANGTNVAICKESGIEIEETEDSITYSLGVKVTGLDVAKTFTDGGTTGTNATALHNMISCIGGLASINKGYGLTYGSSLYDIANTLTISGSGTNDIFKKAFLVKMKLISVGVNEVLIRCLYVYMKDIFVSMGGNLIGDNTSTQLMGGLAQTVVTAYDSAAGVEDYPTDPIPATAIKQIVNVPYELPARKMFLRKTFLSYNNYLTRPHKQLGYVNDALLGSFKMGTLRLDEVKCTPIRTGFANPIAYQENSDGHATIDGGDFPCVCTCVFSIAPAGDCWFPIAQYVYAANNRTAPSNAQVLDLWDGSTEVANISAGDVDGTDHQWNTNGFKRQKVYQFADFGWVSESTL